MIILIRCSQHIDCRKLRLGEQSVKYNHIYFHSFRFAQGTKRYENVSLELIFIYIILLVETRYGYYKSRGGEWAVRLAG